MRRTEYYRVGSLMLLGTCLAASVVLIGCGEERNQEPTAVLSASSLEIFEGDLVKVDGSESFDPDGDPLRFHWGLKAPAGSSVALQDPRTESISFIADKAGTYSVSLSVSDGEFKSDPEVVEIKASEFVAEEGAPVADAGSSRSVAVGTAVRLDGSGSSDPDGDELSYAWKINSAPADSAAELSDPTVVNPQFTPDKAGEYNVSLEVSDGTHTSRPAYVTITAVEENDNEFGPIADAGDNQHGAVGTRVHLDGSASSHPNGNSEELSYFWTFSVKPPKASAIAIKQPFSATASFVPDAEGTYILQLEVRDSNDNLAIDTVTILVERLPSEACLMISGYVQGSSRNKAVALYNCGDETLDLNRFRFCIFSNDESTSCSYDAGLTRTTASHPDGTDRLSAGDVLTLCEGYFDLPGLKAEECDVYQGTFLNNLTGDDRFFVYENTDYDEGNTSFTGVDLVVDAFGQTEVQPSGEPWKDKTFLRCNFEFYDGESPFVVKDYFNMRSKNYITGFTDPPTEGCD